MELGRAKRAVCEKFMQTPKSFQKLLFSLLLLLSLLFLGLSLKLKDLNEFCLKLSKWGIMIWAFQLIWLTLTREICRLLGLAVGSLEHFRIRINLDIWWNTIILFLISNSLETNKLFWFYTKILSVVYIFRIWRLREYFVAKFAHVCVFNGFLFVFRRLMTV